MLDYNQLYMPLPHLRLIFISTVIRSSGAAARKV